MRLKLGPRETVAQESISSRLLVDQGIIDPDFFPTIMSAFFEEAPLLAILDAKGLKTKGLNYQTNWLSDGGRFRTVTSNHIQYRIEENDQRREHFRSNVNGLTYIDDANPTKPGLNKQPFYIFLDSNFIGGKEVILLGDGKTQLWCDNERGGEEVAGGVFRYKVKLVSKSLDDYVDPNIMLDGYECQLAQSLQEQDFSEFANERYTFGSFGDCYLSLQRLKYSYSGTAQAMDKNKVTGRFVQFGGGSKNQAFLPYADEEMMRWAARFLNFQLLEGRGTVSQETKKVVLTDERNKEIMAGDGILYSNDGPMEYPQNGGWTMKFLNNFLTDISQYVRRDETGELSVAVLLPSRSYMEFQTLMAENHITRDSNIVGEGGEKIPNNTYAGYNIGGITLYVHQSAQMTQRPGLPLNDGTKSSDYDGIVIPLGNNASGQPGIQLVQLRPLVKGTVAGINEGGDVSSSVDGTSKHILLQDGVISMNQIFKIYRPYVNRLL